MNIFLNSEAPSTAAAGFVDIQAAITPILADIKIIPSLVFLFYVLKVYFKN